MNLNKLNANYVLAAMFAFLGVAVLAITLTPLMIKDSEASSGTTKVETVTVVKTFTIVAECHDGIAYYNRTSFILYKPNSSEPVKCDGNANRSTNILDEQVYSLTNY